MASTTLGNTSTGSTVKLNENGVLVDFYVAQHDYESGLNGSGRTLVVRKDCYDTRAWEADNVNAYASSDIDTWLNDTYKNLLDADIRDAIGTTKFYYTPGNGDTTVTTLERAIFLLSVTELGRSSTAANVEGTALPVASTLRIANLNGAATDQWTRSPNPSSIYNVQYLGYTGIVGGRGSYNTLGSRPAFTLPSDLSVSDDGSVSVNTSNITTITLSDALEADDQISVMVATITGSIPEDAKLEVLVTNNANDTSPVWEDATADIKAGKNYVFTNKTATNGFAFNFKLTVSRGASNTGGYISNIGGAYQ